MALTARLNHTGMAASTDLRDRKEMLYADERKREREEREAKKQRVSDLYWELVDLEGDAFVEWWDSDDVPATAPFSTHIQMLENRKAAAIARLTTPKE